jgi:hypothetical protein
MTLLHTATEEKLLDTRMIERNLKAGKIAAHQVDQNVQQLPDDAEAGEFVSLETILAAPDTDRRG